jgi:hypothetical protein
MNTSNQAHANSDLTLAWAMDGYTSQRQPAKTKEPRYTAAQIAEAVALSGNPVGA